MGVVEAALWGLSGGGAAAVLSLMTAITSNGFAWPWARGEAVPRLVVMAGSLLLGALVSAAAHNQMSGPWPAFVIGMGAPATVRGLLGGVQVTPRSAIEQAESDYAAARREAAAPEGQPYETTP
jgi:hypothetical protein